MATGRKKTEPPFFSKLLPQNDWRLIYVLLLGAIMFHCLPARTNKLTNHCGLVQLGPFCCLLPFAQKSNVIIRFLPLTLTPTRDAVMVYCYQLIWLPFACIAKKKKQNNKCHIAFRCLICHIKEYWTVLLYRLVPEHLFLWLYFFFFFSAAGWKWVQLSVSGTIQTATRAVQVAFKKRHNCFPFSRAWNSYKKIRHLISFCARVCFGETSFDKADIVTWTVISTV